ncbi:MAG: hypothetical protein OXK78_11375 [Caldilineaceae bacterium]|nr:hypothetical protein [Caldilineaceae bacterium]
MLSCHRFPAHEPGRIRLPVRSTAASQPGGAQGISAPQLTVVAGVEAIELSWKEIGNAARYQLWPWTEETGWFERKRAFF